MSNKNNYKLKLQDHKCFYCSRDLIPMFPGQKKPLDDNPTRDHLIPISELRAKIIDYKNNGVPNNIIMACRSCNLERATTPFLEFFIKKRGI